MNRRDLLSAPLLLATPALGGEPPRRVVALEWNIVSLLLSLGIVPVGAPEMAAYGDWVVEPAIPDGARDIGLRSEPNMELIAALRPNLILASPLNRLVAPMLRRIAPVREVSIYTEQATPLRIAADQLRSLGRHLNREEDAERTIGESEQRLADAKRAVASRRDRPLLIISFLDRSHVRVFGHGSLFGAVLARLDLADAWRGSTNVWGFSHVGVADLAAYPDARLLVVARAGFDPMAGSSGASLWSSLPAVRAGRVATMPAAWFYGDLTAAKRFASLLPNALDRAA